MAMGFGVWTTGCLLVSLVQNFKVVGVCAGWRVRLGGWVGWLSI